jgi:hypothetical protein
VVVVAIAASDSSAGANIYCGCGRDIVGGGGEICFASSFLVVAAMELLAASISATSSVA